jgi:hypothetical protein
VASRVLRAWFSACPGAEDQDEITRVEVFLVAE